jgi:hypothetical protein
MAHGRRRSVCVSRIRGGELSSDPRADHGTGFWRVAAASGAPARSEAGGAKMAGGPFLINCGKR